MILLLVYLNNGVNLTNRTALNIPNWGGIKNVVDKVVIQSKKSLVEISSANNYSQFEGLVEAYHYNKDDYIIRTIIIDDDITKTLDFKYKFDKKGNWIKITKLINGEPFYTLVRKIKYY